MIIYVRKLYFNYCTVELFVGIFHTFETGNVSAVFSSKSILQSRVFCVMEGGWYVNTLFNQCKCVTITVCEWCSFEYDMGK